MGSIAKARRDPRQFRGAEFAWHEFTDVLVFVRVSSKYFRSASTASSTVITGLDAFDRGIGLIRFLPLRVLRCSGCSVFY
jgi:hypothetical protein